MTALQALFSERGDPANVKSRRAGRAAKPALVSAPKSVGASPMLDAAADVFALPFAAALLMRQQDSFVAQLNAAWHSLNPLFAKQVMVSLEEFADALAVEGLSVWLAESAGDQLRQPFRTEYSSKASNRWHELYCYRMVIAGSDIPVGDGQWLLTVTDVTERIERERAHREHETQLFYASKVMSVGEMAAVISHELNHPLASCINFLNGINRKLGSGSAEMRLLQAPVQTAAAQAERAVQIVARIREFVRAREPKRTHVNLAQLFEAVKRWIQRDSAAARVNVKINVSQTLPHLYVDHVMIEQVMVNLAKNAIEALCPLPNDRAAKSITLGAAPASDDAGIAELWVSDSGDGLSPTTQSNLFSPFTSSKQQGMGIGLSICRSIVEFHRGRLWYEPNEGGGAKFIFTLPIADAIPSIQNETSNNADLIAGGKL